MSNVLQGALGISAGQPPRPAFSFIQSSVYGPVIPIVYGLARVAGTILHMPQQPTNPSRSKQAAAKGGANAQVYTAPLIIGLGEGAIQPGSGGSPNAKIGFVWENKNNAIDFATGGIFAQFIYNATVSGSGPYVPTVGPNVGLSIGRVADVGVFDVTLGINLTAVASSPGPNQYVPANATFSTNYTFNAAQAGHAVVITFTYVTTGSSVSTDFPSTWITRLGTRPTQTVWSYLLSNYPAQAVTYPGVVYVANPSAPIPNSSMPQWSFELYGLSEFNPGSGIFDANGADILTDFLTDAIHGANFPAASLGDLTAYRAYGAALGLFSSPVFDQEQPGRDHLAELFTVTNSAPYWSDGLLKVQPYGDTATTANGYTFTPNTTPLYSLTDVDFLPNRSVPAGKGGSGDRNTELDPILVTRKDPAQIINTLKVEYQNRAQDYNADYVVGEDLQSQLQHGPILAPTLSVHSVKTAAVAQQVAQLQVQRERWVKPTEYTFVLGFKYSLVEPTDLLELTDVNQGLNQTPVRVTGVEELENDEGFLVTAEPWPFGAASAVAYPVGSGTGGRPNTNLVPGNTTTPVIFCGPVALTASALEIWIAASGGQYWGGCQVWVSTDGGTTYRQLGTINARATFGTLSSALASGGAYPPADTTNTLGVDVGVSGGVLASVTSADFAAFASLCYVDGEFLAFENAALISGTQYNLTTLARGLYGSTIPSSHSGGTPFAHIDSTVGKFAFPQGTDGETLYFKFPAFNMVGGALQSLAAVSAVAFTIPLGTPILTGAAPPSCSINEIGQKSKRFSTLQINGAVGAAGYGLTWKYQIDGGVVHGPFTSTLPQTITEPRGNFYDQTVFLEVDQGDGQFAQTQYVIQALFDASSVGGRTDEDIFRTNARGGVATPGASFHTLPLYSEDGTTNYVDTGLGRVTTSLSGPTGIGMGIVERGGNKGDNALDSGYVLQAGSADFTRSYTNKSLANVPDDATSDRRASTLNQKTGGDRGFATIDSGDVIVAGGADFSRSYTNKHLGNIPDDATSDRRAATANQKTGGDRGFGTIDSGNVVVAAGADFSRSYTGKHLGNIPDDATSDRRAATANQKTGGDRGFGAIDSGNVVIAGGVDFSRSYTNKSLAFVPDDATSDRRASTLNQKTGGDRGFGALNSIFALVSSVDAAATGSDGYTNIESRRGAAKQAGVAARGITAEGRERAGSGGVDTPGGRISTDDVYDRTGVNHLIDPVAQVMKPALMMDTGYKMPVDVAMYNAGKTTSYSLNRQNYDTVLQDTGTYTFPVAYDAPPQMRSMIQAITEPGTTGLRKDVKATSVTTAGFTARAKYITGGSSTAESELPSATLNGTTSTTITCANNNSAAYHNLSNANNVLTDYFANFDVDTTAMDPSNTLTVSLYRNSSTSGTPSTLCASNSYTPGQSLTGETLDFNGAMDANWDFEIIITYTFTPTGPKRATVTVHAMTYNKVTAGTESNLTSNALDGILFQSMVAP